MYTIRKKLHLTIDKIRDEIRDEIIKKKLFKSNCDDGKKKL